MKLRAWIAGAALGVGATHGLLANGPPPMDRPTPPPCCADGLCYPNPVTWGHYPTRWRRWPGDYLEPLPPQLTPPAPLPADLPPYEAPSPEEEDRRAPPPTAPREAPPRTPEQPLTDPTAAPPGETPPSTTPAAPSVVPPRLPLQPQPGLPFGEPEENGLEQPSTVPAPAPMPFGEPPPTTLPFGGEPPTTLPFGEPMGDADPPPAPPFRLKPATQTPTTRAAAGAEPHGRPDQPVRRGSEGTKPIPLAMTTRG
jgi:hypothetical protein